MIWQKRIFGRAAGPRTRCHPEKTEKWSWCAREMICRAPDCTRSGVTTVGNSERFKRERDCGWRCLPQRLSPKMPGIGIEQQFACTLCDLQSLGQQLERRQ